MHPADKGLKEKPDAAAYQSAKIAGCYSKSWADMTAMSLPPEAQHELDAQGLFCPEPIMMLHRIVRKAASGDVIHVLATDPSTSRDIPKFCQHLGHQLLHQTQAPERLEFWIQKV